MQQANKNATRDGVAQEKMWSISALRRLIGWHDVYGFCVHIRHKAVRHSVIVVDAHKFIVLTICRQFDELAQLTERKLLEINRHTHAALGLLVVAHKSIIACREGGAPCL